MFIKMDTQINKLTKLINDLLETTKLQNGLLNYQKEEIRLDKIIAEVCEEIQMTTSHTIIKDKTDITVIADKARISQVITNLLTNAIKFSPDAGEIIISLARQGEMVLCAVKDFGFGIAKEEQHHIFDKCQSPGSVSASLKSVPTLSSAMSLFHPSRLALPW